MLSRFSFALALAVAVLVPAAVHAQIAPTAVVDGPAVLSFGATLTVNGARSIAAPGASIVRYRWTLDGGAPVETALSSFTFVPGPASPLPPGLHTVLLVVVDDVGMQSSPAEHVVRVVDDIAPTAVIDAPATLLVGRDLTASAARSFDVGGRIVSYSWTLDAGAPVETASPSVTFDVDPASPLAPGPHTLSLVVNDDSGNQSTPAAATVLVFAPDTAAPTAVLDAPATVTAGAPFTLSGARSFDVGGAVQEYRFALDGGAPVVTPDATVVVTATLSVGTHTASLVVVDDSGNTSAPAIASIEVVSATAPVAVITAPATVPAGQSFSVSGDRSFDPDGRIVEYRWTLDARPVVVTPDPIFTVAADPASPLGVGPHTIQLVVMDDSGNLSTADVARVIVADLDAPTAVLDAPAFVAYGQDIVASAARSFDAGGRLVRYTWTLDGGAPIETTSPAITFDVDPALPLAPGPHTLHLVVADDSGNESAAATAVVRVLDGAAPTAVADAPASVVSGQPVQVSGSRSFDIGGSIVEYRWTIDGGPAIVTDVADLALGTAGDGALAVGVHTVTLVVVDDSGNVSSPDTARIDVLPPPDTTAPVVTLVTPANGGVYALGARVAAAFSCDDADSGIATCVGTTDAGAFIDTASVGAKSFTVRATDAAGNVTTVTHTYTVGFVFTGFFAPVDNLPVLNAGQAGRTYPIKWRLADATGAPVTDLATFVDLRDSAIACDAAPEDVLEEQFSLIASSTLRYDAADDQFIYHWRTVKGMAGCRLLQLTLSDGSKHWAKFRLR